MTSTREPPSVWVSDLSLATLPALWSVMRRHGRFALYWTSATHGGRALARLLRRAGVVTAAQQVEISGYAQRVDVPQSAAFRIQAGIESFATRFLERHRALLERAAYPDPRVPSARILANLRQVAVSTTFHLLSFVEEARYWHRTHGVPSHRLVIVSPTAVLASQVPAGWAGDEVEFVHAGTRYDAPLLWLARSVWQDVTALFRRRRLPIGGAASIAVEFAQGLDRSWLMDDLFWWWNSGIAPDRVVLVFDRGDYAARPDVVVEAQRLGLRCVVLHPIAIGESPHLLWRPAPGAATSVRRIWQKLRVAGRGAGRGAAGRWVKCQLQKMLYLSQVWEDFLVEFNARALFHYQDLELDSQSLACDAAGAARIGYQWSHVPWPMPDQVHTQQVYFTWGRQTADFFGRIGSCVDHVLLSGCIVRDAQAGGVGHPAAQQQRAAVAAHGATRVLALFDSSLPCDGFYEFFLQRVIEDPRWGLLIKRKRNTSVPWVGRSLPHLKTLYDQAVATGRVRMLEWSLSPAAAAAAADVAVGIMVVGTSSPAVVAALAGCRTVHLDYGRFHESHLGEWARGYQAAPDRVVFTDPETLWERLNAFCDDPGSDPDFGMMDKALLLNIDPFRDGRAGQRIGEYTRWYVEGVDRGLGRDDALQQANSRFAQRWGSDAVVSSVPATASPSRL